MGSSPIALTKKASVPQRLFAFQRPCLSLATATVHPMCTQAETKRALNAALCVGKYRPPTCYRGGNGDQCGAHSCDSHSVFAAFLPRVFVCAIHTLKFDPCRMH